MILFKLNELAERLAQDPESQYPKEGFSIKKILYEVVFNINGEVLSVNNLTPIEGKKNAGLELEVPKEVERSSNVLSNKTWDKGEYVFGSKENGVNAGSKKKFMCFKDTHLELFKSINQPSAVAQGFINFLNKWVPEKALTLENWSDISKSNLVFRIDGANTYLHEDMDVLKAVMHYSKETRQEEKTNYMQCLVSGEIDKISQLHYSIKGLVDEKPSMKLTSFNNNAFESNNMKNGRNSPVSQKIVINYCNALNWLLKKGNHQKIQINKISIVFWSEKKAPIENCFSQLLGDRIQDGSETQIRAYLQSISKGKCPDGFDTEMPFYILGLVANDARVAVRFWHIKSIGRYLELIKHHYIDICIERYSPDKEMEYPSIYLLLDSVSHNKKIKADKVPSSKSEAQSKNKKLTDLPKKIGGDFLNAILSGSPYPLMLLPMVLRRVSIDGASYYRVALIKGIINRNRRLLKTGKELPMSLDEEREEKPYILGRLFACLERAQSNAQGKVNASIRDKFYSSASTRPSVIYPQLLSLYQHHLKKGGDRMIFVDKIIGALIDKIENFPKTMTTEEQGIFTIGYYHQRNSFFKKKEEV